MMGKRMAGILLAGILTLSQIPAAYAGASVVGTGIWSGGEAGALVSPAIRSGTFSDVPPDHWAWESVEEAVADGAVRGVGDGLFAPASPLTMAQFLTILARAFYGEELAARTADPIPWRGEVPDPDAWYAAAVKVGRDHGLFDQIPGGTAGLSRSLSRYDMASMICALLDDLEVPEEAGTRAAAEAEIADLSSFPSPAYVRTVPRVYALGILQGYSDGTFRGAVTMTRAQAAVVYCRTKDVVSPPETVPSAEETPYLPPSIPGMAESMAPEETDAETILRLVNEARAEAGVQPLVLDEELCAAAEIRAAELPTLFSHDRPDGSLCFTVLDAAGIPYRTAGENIAAGQDTAEIAMEGWMGSQGHRENILKGTFGKLGVGHVQVPQGYGDYWCQLFTD